MPTPNFRQPLIDYIREQAKPVDKFSHQPRLYALTREIGADLTYDDDVVFAATWLHDLGVFIGHRPAEPARLATWDCVAYAQQQTPAVLTRFNFPAEKIPAVAEIIRTHQPHFNPATIEGELVRDADILEQLGAAGILRTVTKIGRDTRFQHFPDALKVLQKNLETLPAQLKLPMAQKLAQPRIQILQAFLHAAQVEHCARPELYSANLH
jgi:uncharacterized protein